MSPANRCLADKATLQYIQKFTSQASPHCAFGTVYADSKIGWIICNPEIVAFGRSPGLEYLLIPCSSREDATLAGNILFDPIHGIGHTSPSKLDVLLHFALLPSDSRFNTVGAIFYTFLSQLTTQLYHRGVSCFDSFNKWYGVYSVFGALSLEDLFGFFYDILLQLKSLGWSVGCILSNLDQHITSWDWLVARLDRLANECELNFKVLVTCSEEAFQPEQWAKWPQFNITFKSGTRDETRSFHEPSHIKAREPCQTIDITGHFKQDPEIIRLIREHPEPVEIAAKINNLFQACNGDETLHYVISAWLRTHNSSCLLSQSRIPRLLRAALWCKGLKLLGCRRWTGPPDVVRRRSSLSNDLTQTLSTLTDFTLEGWLKVIIDSITLSESKIVASTLTLLLGVFRPLTVAEVRDIWVACGEASIGGDDVNRSYLPPDIAAAFRGLLEIRRNDIQFSHPLLPSILSNPETKVGKTSEVIHQEITGICLKYMTSSAGQAALKAGKRVVGMNCLESRHNFLAYAAQYWPHHAKLSGAEWQLNSPQMKKFLNDDDTAILWADLYWALNNPFSCGKTPSSPLASILARHGLDALLTFERSKNAGPLADQELIELLEHASRTAQRHIVLDLLKLPFPNNGKLDGAILAALHSGDEQIIAKLVDFASANAERIGDPQILLCRAASLSRINALAKLIPVAKQRGTPNTPLQDTSVLQNACLTGTYEAVKIIMESDLVISDEDIQASLQLACKYSSAETITYLMDIDTKHRQPDSEWYCMNLLMATIKSGRFDNLSVILGKLESTGLTDKLDITNLLAWIMVTGHIQCGQVLIDHMATTLANPAKSYFKTRVSEANYTEIIPILRQMVQNKTERYRSLEMYAKSLIRNTASLEVLEYIFGLVAQLCDKERWLSILHDGINEAISIDREDIVRLFIQNGVDLEYSYTDGWTALYVAASYGRTGIVRLLIDSKANVNARSCYSGQTALHAGYKYPEIARMLLRAGADINARTKSNATPLCEAASFGYDSTVKVMLEFNPSAESKHEALTKAIEADATNSTRLLLDAGADPLKSATEGCAELAWAVRRNNLAIFRMLLEFDIDLERRKEDPSKIRSILSTAVMVVTRSSDLSIIKHLVDRGSDIESKGHPGQTPLCQMATKDHLEGVRYLLSKGANVNTEDTSSSSPLANACFFSSINVVRFLCTRGADINFISRGEFASPLQAATYRDPSPERDAIVRYLIEDAPQKANVRQITPQWGVPLNMACLNCSVDIVQLMLDNGADFDVNSSDTMGRKPIHYALYQSKENVELLRRYGAELFEKDNIQRGPLHLAVLSGCLDIVRYVLDEGKDSELVNERDTDGWTPLLWATRLCRIWHDKSFELQQLDIIKELLERGADIRALGPGLDGPWSALKLAYYYNLSPGVIALLETWGERCRSRTGEPTSDWDSISHRILKGKARGGSCAACLTVGTLYLS